MAFPAVPYTNFAEVKAVIGITDDTFDDAIDVYILQVSQAFDSIIGTSLTSETVVEYHSGTGFDQGFQLNRMPSVVTRDSAFTFVNVQENGVNLVNQVDFYVEPYPSRTMWRANGLLDPEQAPGTPLAPLAGARWSQGERNIRIEFVTAFVSPPRDVQGAARDETVRIFRKRKGDGTKFLDVIGLEARDNQTGTNVSFAVAEFMPETMRILNHYKRVLTEFL